MVDPARLAKELEIARALTESLAHTEKETSAPLKSALQAVLQNTLRQFEEAAEEDEAEEDE